MLQFYLNVLSCNHSFIKQNLCLSHKMSVKPSCLKYFNKRVLGKTLTAVSSAGKTPSPGENSLPVADL